MSSKTSLDYLKVLSDNNIEFMIEMIETFLQQTPSMAFQLEEHYSKKEFSELKKLAHKMKPTLPMMGISGYEGDFKAIENIGLESIEDDQRFYFHYNRIQDMLKEVYPELKTTLATLR